MGTCLSTPQGSKVDSAIPGPTPVLDPTQALTKGEGEETKRIGVIRWGAQKTKAALRSISLRKKSGENELLKPELEPDVKSAAEPVAALAAEPEVVPKPVAEPVADPVAEPEVVSKPVSEPAAELVDEPDVVPTPYKPAVPVPTAEGSEAVSLPIPVETSPIVAPIEKSPVVESTVAQVVEEEGAKEDVASQDGVNRTGTLLDRLAIKHLDKEQDRAFAAKEQEKHFEEEALKENEREEGDPRELQENAFLYGNSASMQKPAQPGGESGGHTSNRHVNSKRVAAERVPGSILARHNVQVIGDGPELLFLSHGFGTNQHIWGGVLEDLDLVNTYRVIVWDLMGAYSTDPEGFNFQRYSTLHGYADDMLEVLDELEVEELTYIGHSVSGMIGVIASIERPQIFKRLILIGASPRYLDTAGYKGGFSLEMLDQVFAAMQDNYKAWASGFAPMVIGDDVDSPGVREFCRSLFLIRPDIAFSTLKTIFTSDTRGLLPQCKKQVHLLQTSRDAAVPWEPVQYMLDNFPNACVEMLPVAGHLPHLTHPSIVSEALLRHLAMSDRTLPAGNFGDSFHSTRSNDGSAYGSGRVNGNGDMLPSGAFAEY